MQGFPGGGFGFGPPGWGRPVGQPAPAPMSMMPPLAMPPMGGRPAGGPPLGGPGFPGMPPESTVGPELDPVGQTSRWVAAARARESARDDHLFVDPYAVHLAGPQGMGMLQYMGLQATAVIDYLALRTRFLDDLILAATAQGLRQAVILAAGMDARAYRLPWPTGSRVFELDRPEVLAAKATVLDELGATPACERIAIGVDLTRPWVPELLQAGFDPDQPTIWLVEGILPYLTADDVDGLMATISRHSAPGSHLGADVPGEVVTDGHLPLPPGFRIPWTFGTDEPASLLTPHGWQVTISEPNDWSRKFQRLELPPMALPNGQVIRNYFIAAQR